MDANALYFASRELQSRGAAVAARDRDRRRHRRGDRGRVVSRGRGRMDTPAVRRARCKRAAFSGLRHPLVDDAVPNSIALAPPHGVLVTGSNMSGKSTFLRTVGVNVVLAQSINTCLARAYEAPVYQVRSCIGRADDLIAGKSYYLVEVESVLALVNASERPRAASVHLRRAVSRHERGRTNCGGRSRASRAHRRRQTARRAGGDARRRARRSAARRLRRLSFR